MSDINLISKEIVKAVSDHMHSTLLPALLRGDKVKNEDLEDGWHAAIVEILGKQRALIETLTAALKPFAALATEFLDDGDMANKADDRTVWGLNDHDVSYGDFRRAHAALAAAKEQSA